MIRSKIYNLGENWLRKEFKTSESVSDLLIKAGLENKGSNFRTLKTALHKIGLSYEDLAKRGKEKATEAISAKRFERTWTNEQIFVNGSLFTKNKLRRRVLADKLIKYECSSCGLKNKWNNKKIVLPLDHINGIDSDNRLENLRFLCPNCHSQTETFAGKKCSIVQR